MRPLVKLPFSVAPVSLAYDRFDEETRKQVRAEYLQSLKNFHDGNTYKVPGECVIATALKE
jgi:hypothetical protein